MDVMESIRDVTRQIWIICAIVYIASLFYPRITWFVDALAIVVLFSISLSIWLLLTLQKHWSIAAWIISYVGGWLRNAIWPSRLTRKTNLWSKGSSLKLSLSSKMFIRPKVSFEEFAKYLLILLLLLMIVSSFTYVWIDPLSSVLRSWYPWLMALLTMVGAIVLWSNKEYIDVQSQDELDGSKRENEFSQKFKWAERFNISYNLRNTWVSGRYFSWFIHALMSPFAWVIRLPYIISRWLYIQGWRNSLIFLLILVLGMYLRIQSYSDIQLHRDEFNHLNAAKNFAAEGGFNYTRGYALTLLIGFLFSIFGSDSLYIFYLPNLVFAMLTMLFLYLCGKQISSSLGLIITYLFAVTPLAIELSRYIREYEFHFMLMVVSLYLIISRFKYIHSRKDKHLLYPVLVWFAALFLYAQFIDSKSTIYAVFAISLVLIIGFFAQDFYCGHSSSKKLKLWTAIVLALASLSVLYKIRWVLNFDSITFNKIAFQSLLDPNYNKLLYTFSVFDHAWLILFMFAVFGFVIFRKNKTYMPLLLVAVALGTFYVVFANYRFTPRYGYFFLFFLLFFISLGIISLLRLYKHDAAMTFIVLCFVFVCANPFVALASVKTAETSDFNNILATYNFDFYNLQKMIYDMNISDSTVIITNNPGDLCFVTNHSSINKNETLSLSLGYPDSYSQVYDLCNGIYYGDAIFDADRLTEIFAIHSEGYIISDWKRFNKPNNFVYTNNGQLLSDNVTLISYVNRTRHYYVYKWEKYVI